MITRIIKTCFNPQAYRVLTISIIVIFTISACSSEKDSRLFKIRTASSTGLHFNNQITISDSLNAITFEYLYNGGGAAVGDVNNDGKKDLFFAGNMVSSKLFLNKGNLIFEDITEQSGTQTDSWCTGASFVDINDDGLLDLYVCVAGLVDAELRKNIFYINQGLDENGIPHFENKAETMGLDDDGYSTMAVFFDYDKDHDPDMYLLTNSMEGNQRNMLKPISTNGESESTDRFFINNGNGTFSNYSQEAGILTEGFGLGIAICDINQDNWPDVYCANDFISNDLLWINNQDGTFTEKAAEYFKHITNNGMGMDVADYNNDGLLDIFVLDMMPETNVRQKLMFAFRNMDRMHEAEDMGYITQYMRNTLQLNLGKFSDGKYRFSEIGMLAGIHQTDWSWAPLLVDFDNDGWKDLLITNGYRKDVTNLDYITDIIRETKFGNDADKQTYLVNSIQKLRDVKLPNYVFRNNQDLTFENKSVDWGLDIPTFSNGTITADLDDDGDVDIVVNNIDQEVMLFENKLESFQKKGHFLKLKFGDHIREAEKVGCKVWIFQNSNQQFFEYSPYRGYKSTVDQDIHIGLGNNAQIDSIIVQWPDGNIEKQTNPPFDTTLTLLKTAGQRYTVSYIEKFESNQINTVFKDISDSLNLNIKHAESYTNDFRITPTLMKSLSKNGPFLSIGDINQDGLEDVIVGADKGNKTMFLKQHPNNEFSIHKILGDSAHEDMDLHLFDMDSDGDLDLYVVSGGSLWKDNNPNYQDRLYRNDGKGNFEKIPDALPEITSSGSCVVSSDYDNDGDPDLFVGGRLVPRKYPSTPQSYLLENEGGIFTNRADLLGKNKGKLGMVTSAYWEDVNKDQKSDLIIVGEWMQIKVMINENGKFIDRSDDYGLTNTEGWWNHINGHDLDQDGDIDFIVGNYGLNSLYKASVKHPLEIYGKDFDRNGVFDPVMTNYVMGESYIVHPKNSMDLMIPSFRNRFMTYEEYGKATFKNSFTAEELNGAIHLECHMMESVILENIEGTSFKIHPLPLEAQFAPIFGSIIEDLNNDNKPDLMIIGNSMADENIAGYYDASFGNILLNQGSLRFTTIPPAISNFIADGDKKDIGNLIVGEKPVYIITENSGNLQAYTIDE